MRYNFDNMVDRTNRPNLKEITNPEHIKIRGIQNFAAAEMDFKTAPSIIDAIVKCAQGGLFGFTLIDDRYKDAVSWWMKNVRNTEMKNEWIVSTHGTIFSVATALRLLTKKGEGMIVQPPTYFRYEQAATRLGRKTIYNYLKYDNGIYSLDLDDLEKKLADPQNKLLVLCNPQNPIGKVWNKTDLAEISRLAKKYNIVIFSDEIFAETTFENHFTTPLFDVEEAMDNCIVSTSLGKAFNFTGVNHANMIIPNEELRNKFILQRDADHYGSIDPLVYEAVLGAYSESGKDWIEEMKTYTYKNIVRTQDFFRENYKEVIMSPVEGGFSLWANWNEMFDTEEAMIDFLVNKGFVNMDQGSTYGAPIFTRMNLTTTKEQLERVFTNLIEAKK